MMTKTEQDTIQIVADARRLPRFIGASLIQILYDTARDLAIQPLTVAISLSP